MLIVSQDTDVRLGDGLLFAGIEDGEGDKISFFDILTTKWEHWNLSFLIYNDLWMIAIAIVFTPEGNFHQQLFEHFCVNCYKYERLCH